MRCKNCQLLGHTVKFCKKAPACVKCNLPPHPPADCERISCANCNGQHQASSPNCTKFQQAKKILKIKTTKKFTMRETTNQYTQLNPINTTSNVFYSSVINSDTPSTSKSANNSSNSNTLYTTNLISLNSKTSSKNITYNTTTKTLNTTQQYITDDSKSNICNNNELTPDLEFNSLSNTLKTNKHDSKQIQSEQTPTTQKQTSIK